MNTGSVTGTLIVTLAVLVVLFLIFREVICWYWKINQSLALLTEIRDLLASSKAGQALAPPVQTPSSPPAETSAAGATAPSRGQTAIQRLAERVRDTPRLPVDEKIELLRRLGGKFAWDKGSACKVNYQGQELVFPGGKEFGDWLSEAVVPEVLGR